jgi:peptide/nickel transport system permease protein
MPNFWLGLLLSLLFALKLGWLPSQGMGAGFFPLLRSIILPAITLGTGVAATVVRMTRSSMLEVIRQDYIFTARSKGITEKEVTRKHMFKNALIPIITAVGLEFGILLGGAMLTETVFSWPGLGRLMVDAITRKDIPMVLGSVIFMAVMFSIVNLAVDIIYAFVDPRIKSQNKNSWIRKTARRTINSVPSGARCGAGSKKTNLPWWAWVFWRPCFLLPLRPLSLMRQPAVNCTIIW